MNYIDSTLILPDPVQMRDHVLISLSRYWPNDKSPIYKLPLNSFNSCPTIKFPLQLQSIVLPSWASKCGVNGCILVPCEAIHDSNSSCIWYEVDWILAAFLLLEGWHERIWESTYSPIHSYSFKLQDWDERVWHHAWVNRIALFLRCWASQIGGNLALAQMGDIPKPAIHMTHDVDAVRKTFPIRIKQSAFNLYKGIRALRQGDFDQVLPSFAHSIRFLIGRDNWWVFDFLLEIENRFAIGAIWHFYADPQKKNLQSWLMDPGYSIEDPELLLLMKRILQEGHKIGLHPGFNSWNSSHQIELSRSMLIDSLGQNIDHCRQHWLRFSWIKTWEAQQLAGIRKDSTLMFNDRPGFRTSSALCWYPWDSTQHSRYKLKVLPTVIMDSHFYDYRMMSASERLESMSHWIGECNAVSGEVAVLWHPQTLTKDYGYREGFLRLLHLINEVE